MSALLKECPFCGSVAELEDHRTVWAVKCTSAACATIMLGDRAPEPDGEMGDAYWAAYKQTAVDRWNARAIAPPVAAGSVDMEEAMAVAREIVNFEDRLIVMRRRAEKAEAERDEARNMNPGFEGLKGWRYNGAEWEPVKDGPIDPSDTPC